MTERKPLTRVGRRTDVQRLEIRRTFRVTETEDAKWREGADAARVEYSEYLRECVAIGHSMKEAQRLTRRANA